MEEYLLIGTVLRPQGIRGECKVKSYASDISLFHDWKTLYLREGDSYSPVPFRTVRISDGFVYAVPGGCTDANGAEAFRNADLYIRRDQAADPGENAELIADLIGCRAVDEAGKEVGVLTDVLQNGPVDTWVFRTDRGIMMAPALLSAFPEVKVRERLITADSARLAEVAVYED